MDKQNNTEKSKRNERCVLNVRGIKYDVIISSFDKLPNSRLGKLQNLIAKNQMNCDDDFELLCDGFDLVKKEFYFNRDPYVFNLIL